MNKASGPIRILAVGRAASCGEIRRTLKGSRLNHRVAKAVSVKEAKALLAKKISPTVILCEHDIIDGSWKAILKHARNLPNKPTVVVCSRCADERLWVEVLNLGAFDLLLIAPVVRDELVRVIDSAHRACVLVKEQGERKKKSATI